MVTTRQYVKLGVPNNKNTNIWEYCRQWLIRKLCIIQQKLLVLLVSQESEPLNQKNVPYDIVNYKDSKASLLWGRERDEKKKKSE